MTRFPLTALICFSVIPCVAQAYIDPGSGSFMLQMLIASLIGASFTIKTYFRTIKEKLCGLFSCKAKKVEPENKKEELPEN